METCSSRLKPESCLFGLTDSPNRYDNRSWAAGTRVALRIEYNGAAFHGWQAQPHLSVATVQETLETALSQIANCDVRTHCAGRTDTGVHGFGQIVHFDDPVGRSAKAWVMGTNSALPDTVRVHWAAAVAPDFHARFTATARRYRYIIANTPVRPAHLSGLVSWYRRPLDVALMGEGAKHLLGEHDFSAFRAAQCQANSPNRCISRLDVWRRGDFVVLEIEANAFLHHMVRNIAGSLQMVGVGFQQPHWIAQLLEGRDRTKAADTASGEGLYLVAVTYPDAYALPATPEGPALLTGFV